MKLNEELFEKYVVDPFTGTGYIPNNPDAHLFTHKQFAGVDIDPYIYDGKSIDYTLRPYILSIKVAPDLDTFSLLSLSECVKLNYLELSNVSIVKDFLLDDIKAPIQYINGINVREIEAYAFDGCENIKKFNFPELEYIANGVFSKCNVNMNFPNLVEIGDYGFFESGAEEILIPKVKKIGDCVFSNSNNLKYINTESVDIIPSRSFSGCKSLEVLDISNASMIEDRAFIDCINLKSITVLDAEIQKNAFIDCNKDIIFNCKQGSSTEEFCKEHDFKYKYI